MKARACSLCVEADKRSAGEEFFVLKDINPRKPARWLILPKGHGQEDHPMHHLTRAERVRLWKFAVDAAREKFGQDWGLAYNGAKVRTQCHLHIHLGRFIRAAENSKFKLVRRMEDFPAPEEGGVFIHPVPGGFHVHTGENITETALVR
jgi:diadenosine tetraphosphate (Ap4A) HIT family hydrolase